MSQCPCPHTPLRSAAAAARSEDGWETLSRIGAPPQRKELLRELTALPSGLVHSMARGSGRRQKKTSGRLNPSTLQKYFNPVAGDRPIPRNGINLMQSITVEFQTIVGNALTTSTVAGVGYAYFASINGFPGTAAWLTTFDQYKFEQLEVWLEPNAVGSAYQALASGIDLDDASTPATIQDVEDRQGALCGNGGSGRYHKWQPHMAVACYSGAFTSFANEPAGWIDVGSPNVNHYAFKAFAQPTTAVLTYDVTIRAVVSFRSPTI